MQLTFLYELVTTEQFYLLLELYHEEPAVLYRQIQVAFALTNPDAFPKYPGRRREFSEVLTPEFWKEETIVTKALELPQYYRFLKGLDPTPVHKTEISDTMVSEAKIRRLATETAALVLTRYRQSQTFKEYMHLDWERGDFERDTSGFTPLFIGLHQVMISQVAQFKRALPGEIEKWIEGKTTLASRRRRDAEELIPPEVQARPLGEAPIQLAFSPSGAGKTTLIFNELKQNYGFYMVACALGDKGNYKNAGAHASNFGGLLNPKPREGASGDTALFLSMLKDVDPLGSSGVIEYGAMYMGENLSRFAESARSNIHILEWNHLCGRWWDDLLEARFFVFDYFYRSLDPTIGDRERKELWRLFQLECSPRDYFSEIFGVRALFSNWSLHPFRRPKHEHEHEKRRMITRFCLDEAQEDLHITHPFNHDSISCNVFGTAMDKMSAANSDALKDDPGSVKIIIAGTALNANKAAQIRDDDEPLPFLRESGLKCDYQVMANFPLVKSRVAATEVLKAHGVKSVDSTRAVEHGRNLWGRVKWTAMYAKKIQELIQAVKARGESEEESEEASEEETEEEPKEESEAELDETVFPILANEVYETVIGNLQERLEALQTREGGAAVVDKVLEAAISADILDRDHVFYQESDMRLIEDGFAVLESGIDQLADKLENADGPSQVFKIEKKSKNQLTVRLVEGIESKFDDRVVDLFHQLKRLRQPGREQDFAIVGCTTSLNPQHLGLFQTGFSVWEHPIHNLATALERKSFNVFVESANKLEASMSEDILVGGKLAGYRLGRLKEDRDEISKHGFCLEVDEGKLGSENKVPVGYKSQLPPAGPDQKTRSPWRNQLTDRVELSGFTIFDKTTTVLEANPSSPNPDMEKFAKFATAKRGIVQVVNKTKSELKALLQGSFTIVGRVADRLTANLANDGFIIFGKHNREDLKATLKSHGFSVTDEAEDQLTATRANDSTAEGKPKALSPLEILEKELVRKGYFMADKKDSSLVAKLAERVVIDAAIRFAMGKRLDKKMMDCVRLAVVPGSIGNIAENYLAIVSSNPEDLVKCLLFH